MSITKICTQCGWRVAKHQEKKDGKIDTCKVCGNILTDVNGFFLSRKLGKGNGDYTAKIVEQKFNTTISEEMHKKRREYYHSILEQFQFDHKQRIQESSKAHYQSFLDNQKNVPKCPTCGSTNISNIGTIERGVSVGMVGLASSKTGKTHKCNNCGSTW